MGIQILLLIAGMAMLIVGANWFVDGSSVIAKALKVPPLIIGLTLVSMGTSAPEASVSIQSAISGMSDMSLGNVVGSNIFNTLLILGISAVIVPLSVDREIKIFDMPFMLVSYVMLILFAFVITPYAIELAEGLVLLGLFIGYTVFVIVRAKAEKTDIAAARAEPADAPSEQPKRKWKKPKWLSIILAFAGFAGIIFGGDLVVDNAAAIAKALGMSEVLVGLTIVAMGTSLPELVTSAVAAVKKENDIAIGNVIGSNIFNTVFILGISTSISAPAIDISALVDLLIMLVSGALLLVFLFVGKKLDRWQGALFILCYVGYMAYIIVRN